MEFEGSFRSGRSLRKWTSEDTIVRWGWVLYFWAVSLSFGRTRRARRNVDTIALLLVWTEHQTGEVYGFTYRR